MMRKSSCVDGDLAPFAHLFLMKVIVVLILGLVLVALHIVALHVVALQVSACSIILFLLLWIQTIVHPQV